LKFKKDYSKEIIHFVKEYRKTGEPVQVNFRELTVDIKFQDRATHLIHTYPAKLLPNIPYFFVNNSFFVSKGDSVLDPFSGSGTVLLESKLSGMNSFGSDANPLARMITKVKTSNYNIFILENIKTSLCQDFAKQNTTINDYPDVVNLNYWFLPNVKEQLNTIFKRLNSIENPKYRDFFLVCFSNCVKKVSLADNRVSVPVKIKLDNFPEGHQLRIKNEKKLKELKSINVYQKFMDIVDLNIKRIKAKKQLGGNKYAGKICSSDARKLNLKDSSIDFIITSPPYAGAQKYIRASSLSLGWTGLANTKELKILDEKNIGRENYSKSEYSVLKKTGIYEADDILKKIYKKNPLRAHIAANYLLEMKMALKESVRVLKPCKYMVLVAANNMVCGYEFKTQEYLRIISEELGLKTVCRLIDDIKSYGLMTKRNKTASIISCEWVLILKKGL